MNRAAAFARYGSQMTAVYNSKGFQGLLGNVFANQIRGNEELLRQWSESSNQSILMVRVALESLKETGAEAFLQFGQAMGQNIAYAIVYEKSIGDAMRSALASTLESIAAQAFVQAIFSTALGFLRLAEWDYAGATEAFTAAAIFGTVGAAAAIAGRVLAPKQGSSEGGSQSEQSSGADSTGTSSSPASGEKAGTNVTFIINGHIIGQSGIGELTDMINEAVQDRDVRLVSTASKSDQKVTQ
jgi:hypothetical protein